MGTPRTLMLLLAAAGIVVVSAKPYSTYEELLQNRRGWVDDHVNSWGDAEADAAFDDKDAVVDAFNKRGLNPVSVEDSNLEQIVHGPLFNADELSEQLHNRRGFFEDVGNTFQDWGETISDTASKVGEHLNNWGEVIADTAVDAKDAIVDVFDKRELNPVNVEDVISEQKVAGSSLDAATLPERLHSRRGLFDDIGNTFQDWGETISDTASKVGDELNNWGEVIADTAVDVGEAIADTAVDAKDAVVDAFDKRELNPVNVEDAISEQKVAGSSLDAATLPERLHSRRGLFDDIGNTFQDWGETISDTASKVGDELNNWGEVIADTAVDVGEAIADTAVDAKDAVVDAFDKRRLHSRRGLFDDIGNTFQDWGETISDTASKVGDELNNWGEVIADTAVDVGEAIADTAVDAKDAVVDAFDKRELNAVNFENFISEQKVAGSSLDAATLPEKRWYKRRGLFDMAEDYKDVAGDYKDVAEDYKYASADVLRKRTLQRDQVDVPASVRGSDIVRWIES